MLHLIEMVFHLGKWMTSAGYQTALIGKWHLRSEPTGFNYWKVLPGQGEYWDPEMIEMGKKSVQKGYVTKIITDETINWINNRDKNKPFFVIAAMKPTTAKRTTRASVQIGPSPYLEYMSILR